jgi:ribosomal protein L37AE/L43A
MHWYDWSSKTREQQEAYKKQSQLKICPDCKKYPCMSDDLLELWTCIDCGAIRQKEKKEDKETTSL